MMAMMLLEFGCPIASRVKGGGWEAMSDRRALGWTEPRFCRGRGWFTGRVWVPVPIARAGNKRIWTDTGRLVTAFPLSDLQTASRKCRLRSRPEI